jgi:hypothetical protein
MINGQALGIERWAQAVEEAEQERETASSRWTWVLQKGVDR